MNTWVTKNNYKVIQVLSGRCNVYLLTNGKTNILIDTSTKSNQKKLLHRLNDLKIQKIDYLILTHVHFDHATNAAAIKEKFGSQIIIHSTGSHLLKTGKAILPRGTNFITKNLVQTIGDKTAHKFNFPACEYDITVDGYFNLEEIGYNLSIIHTPGHSPDSISIIVDNEIAIAGDALFGIFPKSIFPPFADIIQDLIASWGKLLETGCSIFLPSHGLARDRKIVEKIYNKRRLML